MALDISTLAIEVKSSGIKETADGLDRVLTSGKNAEERVKTLTGAIEKLSNMFAGGGASAKAYADSVDTGLTAQTQSATKAATARVDTEAQMWSKLKSQATTFQTDSIVALQRRYETEKALLDKRLDWELKDRATQALALQKAQVEATKMNQALKGVDVTAAKGHAGIAGITRELIVMGGELQRGNITKLEGSFTVLANRFNVMPALFGMFGIGAVAAVGAVVGAFVALGALVVKGTEEQRAMNNALIETGNYAGTTAGGLNDLAHSAAATSGSISDAKKAVTELAASGKFTSEQIGTITSAAVSMGDATGKSIDKTIKEFESLAVQTSGSSLKSTEEITKATLKLDDKYHFLTESILEQIHAYEKEGNAKAASKLATDTLANATKIRADEMVSNLGNVASMWKSITHAIGGAVDAVENWGKHSPEGDLAKAKANLQHVVTSPDYGFSSSVRDSAIAKAKEEVAKAQEAVNRAKVVAVQQGKDTAASNAAEHAAMRIMEEDAKGQKKSIGELADAQKRYHEELDALRNSPDSTESASPLLSQKAIADHEAMLVRLYSNKPRSEKDDNDQSTRMMIEVEKVKAAFSLEEDAYKSHIKVLDDEYKRGGMSAEVFYSNIAKERADYASKLDAAYEKESDIVANYNNRNNKEEARTQELLEKMAAARNKAMNEVGLKGQEDNAHQIDDENKAYQKLVHSISSAGDAEVKRLQGALDTAKLHNAEIGKTAAQKDEEKAKIESIAMAELQAGIDREKGVQRALELTDKELGASVTKLKYLEQERDLRLQLQQVLLDSASKDIWEQLTKREKEANAASLNGAMGLAQAKVALAYETTKQTIDALEQQLLKSVDMERAAGHISEDVASEKYAAIIAAHDKMTAKLNENNKVNMKIAGLEDMASQFEKLSKSAKEMGPGFANMAKSLSEFGGAFKNLAKAQQEASVGAKNAMADEVGAYGDMATAAQSYFDKGSTGYQIMGDISKAFHLVEMAMTIKSMITNVTATETKTATNLASIPASMAAGAAQMFEQSGWWGFAGVAAMVAVMAGLGFAGGGGGGGAALPSSQQQQASQGTGTVLGDSSAKSQSITKSLDDLKKNSDISLPVSESMLTSLQSIDAAMTGLSQILIRTVGITSGNGLGVSVGKISNEPGFINSMAKMIEPLGGLLGGFMSSLFGHTSSSITDSGLSLGGTMGQLSQGQGVSQYANVHSDTSSFFGLSHSSSDSRIGGGVDQTISDQIGKVFAGISSALLQASSTFTTDAQGVAQKISDFVISIPSLSLRGLSGQALQDALNSVFSSVSDSLAHAIIPDMDAFQKVGEGYFQTLIRIANGVETAKAALDKFGITAIQIGDIINKQGDVGVEIVRQSIVAVETGANSIETGVGKIVDAFDGSVSDLTKLYKSLMDARKLMGDTGINGKDLSSAFIQGAGDLSTLTSGLTAYLDKYFTPSEKATAMVKDLSQQFAQLGLSLPSTEAELRTLISSIDTSTDAGAKLAGSVIALVTPYDDMTTAITTANAAIQTSIDGFKTFITTLSDFRNSLLLGSLSTLTPEQKYVEAQAQYNTTLAAANAGDTTAQGNLSNVANAFLQASQVVNASNDQYKHDFLTVMKDVNDASVHAQSQVAIAQSSLNTLLNINSSVNGVTSAIGNLGTMMGFTDSNHMLADTQAVGGINGSHATGLARVPFDGYIAQLHKDERVLTANESINYGSMGTSNMLPLVNEIKALRAEVSALRSDQNAQTGAVIASNYDAHKQTAETVVAGSKDAAKESAWANSSANRAKIV